MGGAFVFGHSVNTHCIQDLPRHGPHGEEFCLAYRLDYYGLGVSFFVRDGGYALEQKGAHKYEPLDDARIAQYQQAGVLPTPLPPYEVPASTYFWGFAAWPMLLLFVVVALLRRRGATRRHLRDVKPIEPGGAGIEVVADRLFLLSYTAINAVVIEIDGVRHVRSWKTWTFPVDPGAHTVRVSRAWLAEDGVQKATVDVAPGQIKRVIYERRWLGLGPARIRVDDPVPGARVEKAGG